VKTARLMYLLGLLFVLSTPALSKTGDNQQPIYVEADSLEVRDIDNISIYTGNVKLTQGSLEIKADLLTLYADDNNVFTLMEMSGLPATFRQLNDSNLEITGEALKMEYRESESTLLLIDNAKLTQGADIIESNKINVNTNSNHIEAGGAEPENRVHMLIQPKQPAN